MLCRSLLEPPHSHVHLCVSAGGLCCQVPVERARGDIHHVANMRDTSCSRYMCVESPPLYRARSSGTTINRVGADGTACAQFSHQLNPYPNPRPHT